MDNKKKNRYAFWEFLGFALSFGLVFILMFIIVTIKKCLRFIWHNKVEIIWFMLTLYLAYDIYGWLGFICWFIIAPLLYYISLLILSKILEYLKIEL